MAGHLETAPNPTSMSNNLDFTEHFKIIEDQFWDPYRGSITNSHWEENFNTEYSIECKKHRILR